MKIPSIAWKLELLNDNKDLLGDTSVKNSSKSSKTIISLQSLLYYQKFQGAELKISDRKRVHK